MAQETTIHLVLRLRGGGWFTVKMFDGTLQEINLENSATMGAVKSEIYKLHGIPEWKQVLTANGNILSDGETSKQWPSLPKNTVIS